nr:coatomer beta' subunit [Tanacetum cinerariifolium]
MKGSRRIVFGYDEGTIMVKIGREEPVASMDNSGKIIWAKHNEIQTVNIKSVGADYEVSDGERLPLAVKELGTCDLYPQSLKHNPNGRFVVVCGDGEYIIYTALAWRNRSFGSALEIVWVRVSASADFSWCLVGPEELSELFLMGRYWDTVGIDFCEAVEYFFVHGSFANGCNSSFIALIPKVTNAKFAYDSVRWDCLLDVLEAFDFGSIWCKWIRGTFAYAKALVLVNGSPSNEFYFHCGLKQGDPLSPYLFILIMESLHVCFSRVVGDGLFHGIRLNRSLVLTHLFYADDALFIGEWSEVMGVAVPQSMVVEAASFIGCSIMQNQFKYLGVQVGECMSRSKAWDGIILKLRSRLSKWKAKPLSIGSRFTLLKAVLDASPLYTMSIFKAPLGVLKKMESIRNK